MPYDFPIPRPRGCQPRREDSNDKCLKSMCNDEEFSVNDILLHALIGRVTASNDTVHEFETIYDPGLKAIELDIPSCYLDFLETIDVGPNIQRYLRWLIGVAFGGISNNLYWAAEDELTEVAPGRWQTPHKFFPDTLAVFLNGKKVDKFRPNGFTIIDDRTFELKQDYNKCAMKVSVGYMKNETV